MRIDGIDTVPAVDAVIGYAAEGDVPSHGAPPWDAYAVRLYDARAVHRPFTLERNGFELVHWPRGMRRASDRAVRDYAGEAAEFVAARLRADRVAVAGTRVRRAGEESGLEPRVAHLGAHDAEVGAGAVYREHHPDGPGFSRAVTLACWRVVTPPPQDWPLALCDRRSVGETDGMPGPDGDAGPTWLRHRPTHRWYFYPDMTDREVVVSVLHESGRSRAGGVPRASFLDARAEASVPRTSVEVRVIAYLR